MGFSRFRWGVVLAIFAVLVGAGLVLWLRSPAPLKPIRVTYPLQGALFPNDIVPPTFRWEDPSEAKQWRITFEFSDGGAAITGNSDTPSWRPPGDQWDSIKRRSLERDAQVTIQGGTGRNKALSRGNVSIRTSKDPVGAPIFYRDVPLPFKQALEHLDTIRWRLGSVSSGEPPRTLLDKMPVCGNCHSFSADGSVLAMDVDYGADKGAYIIAEITPETVFESAKVISWSDFRREDGQLTFGLLSQISPDGRYVISTVKDRSVFVPLPELYYSQFFFPVQGILAVYDRKTRKFSSLPGADDPRYAQSNPAWSPDGKWIVFTRTEAHELKDLKNKENPVITVEEAKEFVSGGRKMRYDLYRIPFNGGKGGRAEPIPGASGNGKSNYFQKFSPDGKWIVFCQADAFMLLRPDSSLFMMPAEGGNPRRLICNQDQKMNSWHSWSPNGKWIVFASKANGPYTQLWLTHVDDSGNDAPPVLLEHFTDADRAANIPEFVNISPDKWTRIRQRFGDELALALRTGQIHAGTGNDRKAAEAYRKALKIEPDNVEALDGLATSLLKSREVEQARQLLEKASARNPKNAGFQYKLGIAMLEKKDYPAAIEHCQKALTLDPGLFPARIILAHALQGSGRLEEALQHYKELAAKGIEDSGLYNHYGEALMKLKQYREAIPQFQRALQIDPANAQARDNLSRAMKMGSGKAG